MSLETQKINEVTAYLKRLQTATNNTDLSTKFWNDALESRIEYVSEHLETLNTGKTDHIIINHDLAKSKPIEHFK